MEPTPGHWAARTALRTTQFCRQIGHSVISLVTPDDERRTVSFETLVEREYDRLDQAPRGGAHTPPPPPTTKPNTPTRFADPKIADEPSVTYTTRDLFGLALSGGGIRSATFNLGLLQSLERRRILKDLDYVSTVSGGGYIGGFWTAWRQTHAPNGSSFPAQETPASGSLRDAREPAPIRHLREFSRFLMPRVGFSHSETWAGIVTILGGMLPSLAATLSLLAVAHVVWLGLLVLLVACPFSDSLYCGATTLAAITFIALTAMELVWRKSGKRGDTEPSAWPFLITAAVVALLVLPLWQAWVHSRAYSEALCLWPSSGPNFATALWSLGRKNAEGAIVLFSPALVWVAAAIVLLLARVLAVRFAKTKTDEAVAHCIERAAARLMASALVWAAVAGVWLLAFWLNSKERVADAAQVGTGLTGVLGLLFVWLRDWLSRPIKETNATAITRRLTTWLKPIAPQLLANATVVLFCVVTSLLVLRYFLRDGSVWFPVSALAVVLATLWLFNPARVGMHDFYRSRISRCYLGAARAQPYPHFNRATTEQPDDELRLAQLRVNAARARPIHLVCATANNLAGDILGNLYRGGRSAVISPEGVSIGNYTARQDNLRFSSALTASAAAFNSQMGTLSVDLGPAVAFVMCAFNLRLGLWVPHPLNPQGRLRLPGWAFFQEMFGATRCEPLPPAIAAALAAAGFDTAKLSPAHRHELRRLAVHLSDGGHFENLALYELVRRHCRYIVASDCGADPTVAFDDLANAQRRVREDFGVEIEIDVTPLRPDANGRSKQHAVVGTIHYDGYEGSDKGTIIYFKPTLTGDEPPDVLQYQARNRAFPHESTGDQFYDEPQWEAYRRLGQHAGSVVFRFVDTYRADRHETSAHFVENVFLDAGRFWHPAPERQCEVFLNLTERCAALETDIRANAPAVLRAEFFPEAFAATAMRSPVGPTTQPTAEENSQTLYYLMLVAQVMEDVWLGAELDLYWSHPLNDGWMNYFHRWSSTPSFRRWWPVLRPIFSIGFRDFVRDRFEITYAKKGLPGAELKLVPFSGKMDGLVWDYWRQRGRPIPPACEIFEYHLTLDAVTPGATFTPFPVGLLFYRRLKAGKHATWSVEHFFVPPSLNGSGIAARFLTAIMAELADRQGLDLTVKFPAMARIDPASRLQRIHDVNFYKSRGFVSSGPPNRFGHSKFVRPR